VLAVCAARPVSHPGNDEQVERLVVLDQRVDRVVGANERVLALVAKGPSGVLQRLGGEVLSCVYSKLPGGCGHTEHCLGCAIRGTVDETRRTREPKRAVPAFAYVRGPGGDVTKLALRLSAECAGNLVLLRVDEATEV